MNREQKVKQAAGLKKRFEAAKMVVLTDFTGLKVADMNDFRSKVRESGASYQVAKNTLIRLAAKDTDVELLAEHLVGPNGLVTADDDVVAPAKAVHEFAKTSKKFQIKGAVLEGKVIDADQIKALADLPSREQLLAQVLGTMNSVPGGFVQVLAAVPRGLMNALKAIEEQKQAA